MRAPVCPSYLPAHGQADTLTVEVWVDGACVVGDPGVCDYTGPERVWSRSSRAHSTITRKGVDTSEVYGSFRVGRRATIETVRAAYSKVDASVSSPSAGQFTRTVEIDNDALNIRDEGGQENESRLHLAPGVVVERRDGDNAVVVKTPRGAVRIEGKPIRIEAGRASREFGAVEPTTILVQPFAAASDMSHIIWIAWWRITRA